MRNIFNKIRRKAILSQWSLGSHTEECCGFGQTHYTCFWGEKWGNWMTPEAPIIHVLNSCPKPWVFIDNSSILFVTKWPSTDQNNISQQWSPICPPHCYINHGSDAKCLLGHTELWHGDTVSKLLFLISTLYVEFFCRLSTRLKTDAQQVWHQCKLAKSLPTSENS